MLEIEACAFMVTRLIGACESREAHSHKRQDELISRGVHSVRVFLLWDSI